MFLPLTLPTWYPQKLFKKKKTASPCVCVAALLGALGTVRVRSL